MSVPTDGDLIEAVVKGDDRVAAQLYDRLIGVIDRSLYRVFGRRESDHDDLVQTAFEQIVLTLTRGSYAGNCSLKTWAARISVNVGLNALRSRRRERKVLDHGTEFPADSPADVDVERHSDARGVLRVVMSQLADMNPRRAQAVLLHDIHGYDLSEVAAMTEVSVTAAQSRLVRGRKELLKRLGIQERRPKQADVRASGTSPAEPRNASRPPSAPIWPEVRAPEGAGPISGLNVGKNGVGKKGRVE